MEDVSDLPFRLICKRLGADIVYTEFVSSEGLIRDSVKARRKMEFSDEERPFGIQIYGGEPGSMESAAVMAEELHPDLIDINCGCWVRNVVGSGAGAGLLRDMPKMEQVVSSVIKAVRLPVTVKTRLGWDQETIRIVDVARMLEQIGVAALTIHCRTRSQGHSGSPDFSWIPKVKQAVTIPVIVNGSLNTPQGIKQVFDESGCDGVMVARAAIENPWIFCQTKEYLRTGLVPSPPTVHERIDLLLNHLSLSVEHKGEHMGTIEFRKHYSGYLKGLPNSSRVRQHLMAYSEVAPIEEQLRAFAQECVNHPAAPIPA